jgi:hypothetical protein
MGADQADDPAFFLGVGSGVHRSFGRQPFLGYGVKGSGLFLRGGYRDLFRLFLGG